MAFDIGVDFVTDRPCALDGATLGLSGASERRGLDGERSIVLLSVWRVK